jgi:O-antigen/teichoic acid export membrane protein
MMANALVAKVRARAAAALAAAIRLRQSLFSASLMMAQPLLLNLLSVPATGYIIAKLGALAYGEWAVAVSLSTTALIVTNLGLRSYFVRRIAQNPECAAAAFRDQLGARVLLSFAAAGGSIVICWLLRYPAPVVMATAVLSIGLLFTAVASCVADLLQALERLPTLASINMIAGLTLTAASVVTSYLGLGIVALAGAYLVGPLLSAALSLAFVHRRLFPVRMRWSLRETFDLLVEARVMGAQVFVGTLANQAENLIVPYVAGLAAYGQFAAGTLLVRRLDVVPDALCTSLYPRMARAGQSNDARARRVLRGLAFVPLAFCIPAAVAVFLLAGPISRLLFPQRPELTTFVIQLTVWWVPLLGLATGLGYALNAARRERQETALLMSATVFSLICTPLLIWRFGVLGACLSLLLRQGAGAMIRVPIFLSLTSLTGASRGGTLGEPKAVAGNEAVPSTDKPAAVAVRL